MKTLLLVVLRIVCGNVLHRTGSFLHSGENTRAAMEAKSMAFLRDSSGSARMHQTEHTLTMEVNRWSTKKRLLQEEEVRRVAQLESELSAAKTEAKSLSDRVRDSDRIAAEATAKAKTEKSEEAVQATVSSLLRAELERTKHQLSTEMQKVQTAVHDTAEAQKKAEDEAKLVNEQHQELAELQMTSNSVREQGQTSSDSAEVQELTRRMKHYEELLTTAQEQLRSTRAQLKSEEAARDTALRQVAASRAETAVQTKALNSTRKQLGGMKEKLEGTEGELSKSVSEVRRLQNKTSFLENVVATTKRDELQDTKKAYSHERAIELQATLKVRSTEDEADRVKEELAQTKSQLQGVLKDYSKTKDDAIRAADEAFQASHDLESAKHQVAELTKIADAGRSNTTLLLQAKSRLERQRDELARNLQTAKSLNRERQDALDDLQEKHSEEQDKLQKAEARVKTLQESVSEMDGAQQRAETAGQEIINLQTVAKHDSEEIATLTRQIGTLRTLSDGTEAEAEEGRNEVKTLKARDESLESQLKTVKQKLQDSEQQRLDASLEVKRAKSQEEVFFTDEFKIQSENEKLSKQLDDALATNNATQLQLDSLKHAMQELEDDKRKESEAAHMASIAAEKDLLRVKEEARKAEAENAGLRIEVVAVRKEAAAVSPRGAPGLSRKRENRDPDRSNLVVHKDTTAVQRAAAQEPASGTVDKKEVTKTAKTFALKDRNRTTLEMLSGIFDSGKFS